MGIVDVEAVDLARPCELAEADDDSFLLRNEHGVVAEALMQEGIQIDMRCRGADLLWIVYSI